MNEIVWFCADDSTAVEEAEVDTAASSAAAAAAAAAPEGVASPSTPTDAVDNTQGKEDSKAGKDTPAKGVRFSSSQYNI